MNRFIRNFLTHPLMKLAYGIIIISICYFGYEKAYNEIVSKYDKLTKITVLTFDSSKYAEEIKAFNETELEILYPIGQKANITREDANAIAEQSLKASMHRNIKLFKPFTYYYDSKNQLYMIEGSDPLKLEADEKPGHPYVIIQKIDGKVIAMWLSSTKGK